MGQEAPKAKLVCIAGPMARAQFMLLGKGDWVIGRAPQNAISIRDSSVSRRHVGLRYLEGQWLARDLGSGNGTLVNGQRITAERKIRDGDILLLGETRLELIDPSEPRTLVTRRLWTRRTRMLVVGAGVAVLLLLWVGTNEKRRRRELRRLQERTAQKNREQLDESFQRGKNLIREGKWSEAKAMLEQVERVDPNFPDLRAYFERIERELPNQEKLVKAEAALNENQLGQAAEALAKVSKDTIQHERVGALQGILDRKIQARLEEARAAFEAEDYEMTAQVAADILRASPLSSEGEHLMNAARKALEGQQQKETANPRPDSGPWRFAVNQFAKGDLPGAIAALDRCAGKRISKCKTLAARMRDLDQLQKRVDYLDTDSLKRLIALDRQIVGRQGSAWSREAKSRLGQVLLKLAASAETSGDWGKAGKIAHEAIGMDPSNGAAVALLHALKSKAKDVYLNAYTLRDSEPEAALAKFREVLQMTSPKDETYQRAKSWIEKLSK